MPAITHGLLLVSTWPGMKFVASIELQRIRPLVKVHALSQSGTGFYALPALELFIIYYVIFFSCNTIKGKLI